MESAIEGKSPTKPKNSHYLAFLTTHEESILLVIYNPPVKFMHEKSYIFGKKEKIHLQNQSWLTQNDLKIMKYKHPILFP